MIKWFVVPYFIGFIILNSEVIVNIALNLGIRWNEIFLQLFETVACRFSPVTVKGTLNLQSDYCRNDALFVT